MNIPRNGDTSTSKLSSAKRVHKNKNIVRRSRIWKLKIQDGIRSVGAIRTSDLSKGHHSKNSTPCQDWDTSYIR